MRAIYRVIIIVVALSGAAVHLAARYARSDGPVRVSWDFTGASAEAAAVGVRVKLESALHDFVAQPTAARKRKVWAALREIDASISRLAEAVDRTSGGPRAEAEIERIELQIVVDRTLERLAQMRAARLPDWTLAKLEPATGEDGIMEKRSAFSTAD